MTPFAWFWNWGLRGEAFAWFRSASSSFNGIFFYGVWIAFRPAYARVLICFYYSWAWLVWAGFGLVCDCLRSALRSMLSPRFSRSFFSSFVMSLRLFLVVPLGGLWVPLGGLWRFAWECVESFDMKLLLACITIFSWFIWAGTAGSGPVRS